MVSIIEDSATRGVGLTTIVSVIEDSTIELSIELSIEESTSISIL